MKRTPFRLAFIIFLLLTLRLSAQEQKFYTFPEFEFQNGEIAKEIKIGFREFGTINSDSSNIIIVLSWFGGTSSHLTMLLGNDRVIDTVNYYVICFDTFGNGVSSSPDNYTISEMPNFTINDMVKAQYKYLTEVRGFNSIFAAVGGSMGGMQVFDWVVSYPAFLKKAVSYVSTPRTSNYSKMIFNFVMDAISYYEESKISEQEATRIIDKVFQLLATGKPVINSKDEQFFLKFDGNSYKSFPLINRKSQTLAMISHDIIQNRSYKELKEIIKTKLLIMVSDNDDLVTNEEAINFGNSLGFETIIISNNGGHYAPGMELQKTGETIRRFLSED